MIKLIAGLFALILMVAAIAVFNRFGSNPAERVIIKDIIGVFGGWDSCGNDYRLPKAYHFMVCMPKNASKVSSTIDALKRIGFKEGVVLDSHNQLASVVAGTYHSAVSGRNATLGIALSTTVEEVVGRGGVFFYRENKSNDGTVSLLVNIMILEGANKDVVYGVGYGSAN